MLHVGIVTPRYPPTFEGGGERSVQLLATNLPDSNRIEKVTVLTFDGDADGDAVKERDEVTVERLGSVSPFLTEYQNLRVGLSLRSRLGSFDIVHAYNMELNPAVGFITERQQIPSIATLNSYHFFPKSVSSKSPGRLERVYELVGHRTTNRILIRFMKRIDQFTALSEAMKQVYVNQGFDGDRLTVVPNMLDSSFEVPDNRRDGDDVGLLYVGTLSDNKGVSDLLDALTYLPEEYHLRIVGSGPSEETLRTKTRSNNLTSRVTFAGWVPNDQIGTEYARADLFVHPGIWPEPFGRTILEAMQSGLPVVCTDRGGPPEIVPDSECICEAGAPKSLASAIEYASKNRDRIGSENKDHVRSMYAPATIVSNYVDIYEEVRDRK